MRILYIDIDSLRPDHLGCYGYHRNTSPNIDAIAAEGIRLGNVHCTDAPCLPSRTALYTGQFGIHTGVVGHGGTAADLRPQGPDRGFRALLATGCLPAQLQDAGFHTAQISPFGQRHTARQFLDGFHEIHNTGKGGMESAEEVQPVVNRWLDDNAEKDNWYLHINYWDPHTPYRTPANYPNHFADDPLPAWLTEEVFERHQDHVGPHSAQEINMYDDNTDPRWPKHPGRLDSMDDLRTMIDGYDNGVRYADDQVGEIVAKLKQAGVYDDTVIVISADHGENLGELGIYGEHGTADQITTRIPMIVRWPGKAAPGTSDAGLHYHLDWGPTVMELLGEDAPGHWDGESYAGSLTHPTDSGRPYLVVGQCCHVCQRSVRFGPWMYIRTYHDGYHLFPTEMLYNIQDDPHEQVNVAEANPEVCNQALRYLTEWHDDMMATGTSNIDPLWTVIREGGPLHARGYGAAYAERLEATGRGWAVPELKKRHPREFE